MWKFISLFIPLFLIGEELEVHLPTRTPLAPIYLTKLHAEPLHCDWRYLDELRNVLEFDLTTNGFSSILPLRDEWEEKFQWSDVRGHFDLAFWQKERIPYVCAVQIKQNDFQLFVFDVQKGTSKKYTEFAVTGRLEEDRRQIHRLADKIQKDLFGIEGIASLKILYSQRHKNLDETDWSSDIWVCDSDGANARQVTFEKEYCLSPGFLPYQEGAFYYVSYKLGQSKIYRASLSNPKGELLISLRGSQALPALTKNGTALAFIADVAGRPDLFLQRLDKKGAPIGKARQLYSAPRATQASPSFNPNGKQIAFVSDKDGSPRIYLLDILDSQNTEKPHPRLITQRNRENTSPSWSPDGTKLAYSAKTDEVRQIWIYDFATEEETQLTFGEENKENPMWAPDSLHLIYNTESNDICELYILHFHHPDPILISKGPGQKRFSCWESR